ncbi:hypothetical protein LCGC14_1097760 [marine sediment metagenome]|uniref:Uncharacterized protein n=1 Tax=marine sediment metagenome TaxID=412755 RepID=A0A0F9QGH0_9ZZZZ|nr:hypothetical protein [Candidatus Aminicenantes bacterium]
MKENTKREKAFQWVLWNVLKHNDQKLMRWWEILVRYFFMPFNTFWYYLNKHHNNIVDDYGRIIRLFGVDYNISIFRALMKPGSVIKVIKNKYGTIMIEKVDATSTSDSVGTSTL